MQLNNRAVIVLDVGKALTKLSLWSADGKLLLRRIRNNERIQTPHYLALDAAGIEQWLSEALPEFASIGSVGSIITVGHGAAAAIVRDGRLACPPLDYEYAIPEALRLEYEKQRDPFAETGSPSLRAGLNLGAQLHFLETLDPTVLGPGSLLIPWPQYWAWVLTGEAASEVTSLACHTDLWRPLTGTPSNLAVRRGWARALAPLRRAGAVLGTLTLDWAQRTGLSADVAVHCGLHDSNAALLAARGFTELAERDFTVLSTGTWFVSMRSMPGSPRSEIAALPVDRDCVVNVDAFGKPIPSARFAGGREIELLTGQDTHGVDLRAEQPRLVSAIPRLVEAGAMVLPTLATGYGPFPEAKGRWLNMPADENQRRAAVYLYAALVADTSLDLIGARDSILVEGRFSEARVFVGAIASLRPEAHVFTAHAHRDVSFGAIRLLKPSLAPPAPLTPVRPLGIDLMAYRERWRSEIHSRPGRLNR